MSTAAAPKYGKTFQQTWLSDQGAWPIIGILGGEWRQQHRQIPPKVRRPRSCLVEEQNGGCRPDPGWPMAVCRAPPPPGAVVFCGGFIARKVVFHPDVRVTAAKRHAVIREWK